MVLRRVPVLGLLALAACGGQAWQKPPYDLRFQSVPQPELHEAPEKKAELDWWYTLDQTTIRPLSETLSIAHWVDVATDGPPAHDVNALDEVLDSSWFTNRLGRTPMSVDDVVRGPNRDAGPAHGPLLVESGKVAGASPGLVVRDQNGARYLVKFDPPAHPGLASGAELVATKILHAAGYFVPENHVRRFPVRRLELAEGALGPGKHGQVVPFTEESLADLILLANPSLRGEIQALFSRILDGTPVGPFSYEGKRSSDPNDTIPHERRRSLRALRWFSAWVNNTDIRASNTMDVFRAVEGERGFLTHYLLDFGNALGSLGTKPKYQSDGYEPIFSWGVIAELFFSAGLRYRYWLPARRPPYRSVGMLEADVFDPPRWSPAIPNPAFDACTAKDTLWAAGIMARFTRPMVDGIVYSADFGTEEATRYVADTLWARRRKILDYAFGLLPPLFDARVEGGQLVLSDLGVRELTHRPAEIRYRWQRGSAQGELDAVEGGRLQVPLAANGTFETVRIERLARSGAGSLEVRLARVGGVWHVVGLER